ncbi:histone deacetylase [Burkholderia pseudomallei]|nr:histone deacetylase [Burkholderia pseudomallei]ARL50542.1 histone deacetylase [Burkholderia pseudomallei]AYX34852.1 histone deacetylase [Burkholderia pseudomallei]
MDPRRRAGPPPLPLATHRRRACRSMHLALRQAARFDRAVRIGMSFGR